VRSFSNSDKPEIPDEELKKQLIPLYWVRGSRHLSTDPGMHRWVWHLHYAAPSSMRHEYPIAAVPHDTPRGPFGPTVVPGTYKVQLTVDGKSFTAPLTVKMDPRVKTPLAALQKKEQAETRQAAIITQTTQALLQANSIRSQLEKLSQSNEATKNALAGFQKKLTALVGAPAGFLAPPSPEATLSRVNGEASTLYQQSWSVDAEPTSAQMEALDATERAATDLLKRWTDLKNTSVPELNRVLRESQAPEVRIEDHPPLVENAVDEE
jgi:FtsZ-binding cell division protein ZapB